MLIWHTYALAIAQSCPNIETCLSNHHSLILMIISLKYSHRSHTLWRRVETEIEVYDVFMQALRVVLQLLLWACSK